MSIWIDPIYFPYLKCEKIGCLIEPTIFASLSKNAPSEFISSHCFVMQRDIREHNCKAYKKVAFSLVCTFKKDLTLKYLSFYARTILSCPNFMNGDILKGWRCIEWQRVFLPERQVQNAKLLNFEHCLLRTRPFITSAKRLGEWGPKKWYFDNHV